MYIYNACWTQTLDTAEDEIKLRLLLHSNFLRDFIFTLSIAVLRGKKT